MEKLFIGLNLDQLVQLEMEIDLLKLESYSTLGIIEEMDSISNKEFAQFDKKEATLDKIFAKLDNALSFAIEIASLKEMEIY